MITHIFKDGTTSNDITGHLVKRTDCPTAYKVMKGMNEHIGHQDRRAQACQEVQIPGEACQERQHEGTAQGYR